MGDGIFIGIAIGIFVGVLLDRFVLKATVPWLLDHGWR